MLNDNQIDRVTEVMNQSIDNIVAKAEAIGKAYADALNKFNKEDIKLVMEYCENDFRKVNKNGINIICTSKSFEVDKGTIYVISFYNINNNSFSYKVFPRSNIVNKYTYQNGINSDNIREFVKYERNNIDEIVKAKKSIDSIDIDSFADALETLTRFMCELIEEAHKSNKHQENVFNREFGITLSHSYNIPKVYRCEIYEV